MNILKIEDLRKDYDELQVKYGAKELDSIYNGGCEKNPDICFVFMNPTGKILPVINLEEVESLHG